MDKLIERASKKMEIYEANSIYTRSCCLTINLRIESIVEAKSYKL